MFRLEQDSLPWLLMIILGISHPKPSLKPCARARDGLREKRNKEMWIKA
jgi:hypothetical protein